MNEQNIHETGLHKGVLLCYALTNIIAILGFAVLVGMIVVPQRMLLGGIYYYQLVESAGFSVGGSSVVVVAGLDSGARLL